MKLNTLKLSLSFAFVFMQTNLVHARTEQIGTVGYFQIENLGSGELELRLSSGGASDLQKFQPQSKFYNCANLKEVIMKAEVETTACSFRLNSGGLIEIKDLQPKALEPLVLENVQKGTDHRFDLRFTAGAYKEDSKKFLVWIRGDSAKSLFEALRNLDAEKVKEGRFSSPTLNCFATASNKGRISGRTKVQGLSYQCQFLVNSEGEIEKLER